MKKRTIAVFQHHKVEHWFRSARNSDFHVIDTDHGHTAAVCSIKGDACLIASLLTGQRKACREVATIHRPTCGAGSES